MHQSFNILISSAGRRVALVRYFQAALLELGMHGKVLAADLTAAASGWHAADHGAFAPRFATGQFIDQMLALCEREKISLLVPTIDTELPLYSYAKDKFASIGTTVAVSGPSAVLTCEDKKNTHQWLRELGMPVPRQGSISEILDAPTGEWPTPLIVKPARGSSSINMRRIHQIENLRGLQHPEIMVAETIAPGDEYTIDVYIDKEGEPRCAVPRMRLETRSGEVSKGMTVREPKLQQMAMEIASALPDAFGVINIQVFYDRESGELNVIEINPRFGGGYPLTHEAGATCTHWLIENCLDLPISCEMDLWRDGLVMLRYDDAVFVDKTEIKM